MQVETFECEETAAEHIECSDEAIKIIESLELDGQRELLSPSEKKQRSPYRKMTAEEIFVYRQLCPATTSLKRYSEGPIPLRVLQVAAHVDKAELFDEVEVWHRASPAIKDPVLVGKKKRPKESWVTDFFILARWGEALDEWPFMLKQSHQIWRDACRSKLAEIKVKVESDLALLDTLAISDAASKGLPAYGW